MKMNKQVKSGKCLLHSESGFTLLEIMVTLAIVCLFTMVFTQMMGISVEDVFFRGNQMEATAKAQGLLEKIRAVVENNSDTLDDPDKLDTALQAMGEYCTEEDLLVYNANQEVRFYYNIPSIPVDDDSGTDDVPGINVTVVVFYNNGNSYIRVPDFIYIYQ